MPAADTAHAQHPQRQVTTQSRGGAKLVVVALLRKHVPSSAVVQPGACRAELTFHGLSVKVGDGHIAGLVAWVLGANYVDVHLSTFPEHSHRIGPPKPLQSAALERRRASLDIAIRDEAWFTRQVDEAFLAASLAGARRQEMFAKWGSDLLSSALKLVPASHQVNTRFGRVLSKP